MTNKDCAEVHKNYYLFVVTKKIISSQHFTTSSSQGALGHAMPTGTVVSVQPLGYEEENVPIVVS